MSEISKINVCTIKQKHKNHYLCPHKRYTMSEIIFSNASLTSCPPHGPPVAAWSSFNVPSGNT